VTYQYSTHTTFSIQFEKVASSYPDDEVGAEDLTILAALASAFDKSGDEELQKEAADIDQMLIAIANPKNALAKLNEVYDKELNKLREEGRREQREKKYSAGDELAEMGGHKAIADAVDKQVRRYRPMEAPLSTRYSPDRPGVSLMRITDSVYQDPTTGKIYNYESGYKTDKGNEIPGSSVKHQTEYAEGANDSRSMFTTRESLSSQASADIKKKVVKAYEDHINDISTENEDVRIVQDVTNYDESSAYHNNPEMVQYAEYIQNNFPGVVAFPVFDASKANPSGELVVRSPIQDTANYYIQVKLEGSQVAGAQRSSYNPDVIADSLRKLSNAPAHIYFDSRL